ncbi:16S rRNA (guanine(966)-N(2))-methyltransferase RsmD [Microbacterium kribbense]|uniref:16S rRNA (Guanine(966)-N(2))-methyltransferase RsmD n=1 Tax=Microbacterium kribbense TaxID=433645 RepID=A0ABP7GDG1_9MICO
MTRIIAGGARGIRLSVPAAGTRPTSDRVRESLFGALESADALDGARVLDLYAGSGALGLEALSRGAASVDLVERSPAACDLAKANAAKVTAAARVSASAATVHRTMTATFLRRMHPGLFDLVFLDPPYDAPADEVTAVLQALVPLMSPGGIAVLERAARSGQPQLPDGLDLERSTRYGDTALWWLRTAA